MPEWWTYRPEDFLLFSPRVYWRMFELHNVQVWPLPIATLGLGLVAVVLVLWRKPGAGLLVALLLAALWFFIGWSFLWNRYAEINWAIAYIAPIFGIEALLLTIAALHGSLFFDRTDVVARTGLLIAVAGMVVYPLLAPALGRPWTQSEIFGIAPDPTAIATLGLMLSARGTMAVLLLPIPITWLLVSGLTLHTMGDAQGWIAFAAAGAAAALSASHLLFRRWRTP